MNVLFFIKAFFGTVGLLIFLIFLFERFVLVGKVYTGPKTTHLQNGEFILSESPAADKSFGDLLKWNTERNSVAWNEPYTTDTIALTALASSTAVRSTFINHATILIETKDYTLITDPIFSKYASPFSFMGPARHHDPYVPLANIPKLDFVLISHAHYDHLSVESIMMIEARFHPTYIVPLNNGQLVERAGVPKERIVELDTLEQYQSSDKKLTITLDEAKHWSARGFSDRRRYLWGSYVIDTAGKRLYFAGDTGYGDHFKKTLERVGHIDEAFLPIGAYEPRWFMKDHHMNPEEALQAAHDLGDPAVTGIHFGTFKLTDEGRYEPEQAMKTQLAEHPYSNTFLVPTIENGLQIELK